MTERLDCPKRPLPDKSDRDYECRDKAKYGVCNSYPHCVPAKL